MAKSVPLGPGIFVQYEDGSVARVVSSPSVPKDVATEMEKNPYRVPNPWYLGVRIEMDVGAVQHAVQEWLARQHLVGQGDGLVFSWQRGEEGLSLTVCKHAARA